MIQTNQECATSLVAVREIKSKTDESKFGTEAQPLVVKSIEAEKSDKRLKQDKEEGKEATEREQRIAFWSIVVAIATCLTVIVGAAQMLMFWRQLRLMAENVKDAKFASLATQKSADAAENAVKLARDEFNASHRPWVKCDVELAVADATSHPSAVKFDTSGMYLTLKFTLTNVGTAPALNVMPEWSIVLRQMQRDFFLDTQRHICEEIKNRERGKYADGLTIFPGQTLVISITAHVPQAAIEADIANGLQREGGAKIISVSAIGCIDYRSAMDLQHHQTGFCYYVCATQADNGKMMLSGPLLPVQTEPIAMSDLYLSANHFDGHLFFAD